MFFRVFQIISLFNWSFFHIFQIISLFNLSFFHIFKCFPLINKHYQLWYLRYVQTAMI
jgi:hypothetical protein